MSILEGRNTKLPALLSINPIFINSLDRGTKYLNGRIFVRIPDICDPVFYILTLANLCFSAYYAPIQK